MTPMSSREWADGVVKCMNACLYYFQYVLDLWWQLCFHFHSAALCVVLSVNQVIKLEFGLRSSWVLCVCLWVFFFFIFLRFMVCIWIRQLGGSRVYYVGVCLCVRVRVILCLWGPVQTMKVRTFRPSQRQFFFFFYINVPVRITVSHVFMTVEISSRGYTLNDICNNLLFYCDRRVSVYVCVTCICAFFFFFFCKSLHTVCIHPHMQFSMRLCTWVGDFNLCLCMNTFIFLLRTCMCIHVSVRACVYVCVCRYCIVLFQLLGGRDLCG